MMIEVLGDKPVSRTLGKIKHDVQDWSEVWPEVAKHLARGAQRQFDSHGEYGSAGWAPLAESTLMYKRLLGLPEDPLRARGALEQSLILEDDPNHVQRITPEGMDWGTDVAYAMFHQKGTARMPMRRPVEPPEGSRRYMVRILQQSVLSNVTKGA